MWATELSREPLSSFCTVRRTSSLGESDGSLQRPRLLATSNAAATMLVRNRLRRPAKLAIFNAGSLTRLYRPRKALHRLESPFLPQCCTGGALPLRQPDPVPTFIFKTMVLSRIV